MKRRQLSWPRMETALRFRREIAPSGLSRRSLARGSRFLALLVPLIGFELAVSATAATFTVDSTGDASDAKPGSGICGTVPGVMRTDPDRGPCTLRAAIEEANAFAGTDTIQFNIPASDPFCSAGVCTINLGSALPGISAPLEIDGPGADKLTVRPATGVAIRNFNVTATGVVTFFRLTISNGSTGSGGAAGGGIFNSGSGTVNVIQCALTGNSTGSSGNGGGIFNSGSGTVNVMQCALTGNASVTEGGGIGNDGILNVSNSTFSDNFGNTGGGILNKGTANITNSTFSGNQATSGGGVANLFGTVNLTNSTITGNSVHGGPGGGLYSAAGTFNVKSSLIAMNTSSATNVGLDVDGNFVSAGFNLIGKRDRSAGFTATTDQTGTVASPLDPKLDPNGLQNNGGPTKTIALLSGSPAIDKATSNGLTGNLTTDQRGSGFPRTFNDSSVLDANDGTDIGAFERPTTTLANISTRLRVETGDNALIGGFIVSGTQNKKVIVLAIGPSLPFPDKLANPTLELYQGNTLLESNDDWISSANKQAIMDSGVAPPNNLESAIIRTLPANNSQYTAIVRGVSNGTGIASVQVYDLDRTTDSKLANISTRGFVQGGDNVMIAGFIISGAAPQKVIVLAIGPSLTVPGKLPDPTLQLVNQQGTVLDENDNWGDSANKQAIIDSGVAPTNSSESAIVATLPSGNAQYTAIVRGAGGATGVAVVQVYALQ